MQTGEDPLNFSATALRPKLKLVSTIHVSLYYGLYQ